MDVLPIWLKFASCAAVIGAAGARHYSATHFNEMEDLIDETLKRLGQELPAADWEIEPLLDRGMPAAVICERAARDRIDRVVVGTHGRTGVGRALIGSVTEQLMSCLPCDVLAVRPPPG